MRAFQLILLLIVSGAVHGQETFTFDGGYENEVPEGEWTFTRKALVRDQNTKLVDYKYVTTVSGTEDNITGTIREGKPHGLWFLNRIKIDGSEISDTLFKSSINYDSGIPQLSVRMENVHASLVARFLRNGLAHDQWTLFREDEMEAAEEWFFADGLLQEIHNAHRGSESRMPFFQDSTTSLTVMPLSRDYLSILRLSNADFSSSLVESEISNLLLVQDEILGYIEENFTELKPALNLRDFRVKVPNYEISAEVERMLLSIATKTEESLRIADGILSNSQLNIAKLSDTETSYQFNVSETISTSFLEPLSDLEEYIISGIYRHVTMDDLLSAVFPKGISSTSFKVNVADGSEKMHSGNLNISTTSPPSLEDVDALATYCLATLNTMRVKLSSKASIEIREKAIVSEEELLVGKAQDFKVLIDALKSNASEDVIGVLDHINVYSEKELTEYAKMEDSEEKLERAIALEKCYEDLTELSVRVGGLDEKLVEIEVLYTDEVWNPFTSTLMDESVKRRIVGVYNQVLVPHTLAQIKNELACSNTKDYVEKFDSLHERMTVLRDMKTKKLERKLKRKKEPEEILSILGIENF